MDATLRNGSEALNTEDRIVPRAAVWGCASLVDVVAIWRS